MSTPQRLPIVGQDDGTWGNILDQYLSKEHTNDGTDNAANGGHQHITITASDGTTGTAPITFTSGTNLTTPAAGAMEYDGSYYYLTTSAGTRKKVAIYDVSGATGDIYYRDSSGNFKRLAAASDGTILTLASGVPAWTSDLNVDSLNDTSGNQQFETSDTDMVMNVDMDMEGHFVWNMHDPTDAQDATTKIYVDNLVIDERSAATTLTSKTLTNPTINNYTEGVVAIGTVTTASTISLTSGTVQTATLTASTACTFTMPTAVAGKSFTLFLKQAATTGGGTATFTGVKWPGGTAPTITATAAQMDVLTFVSDGTNWYGTFIQGFTP